MHAYLYRRFGHAGPQGGFRHGEPFELHQLDGQAMAVGQVVEQHADIAPRIRRLDVGGHEQAAVVLERLVQRLAARMGAEEIHELVACDRVHPRSQRLFRSIGVTGIVHGQQGLLQDVFHVVLPAGQNTRRGNIETYFSTNGVRVAERLELDAMMGTLQFVAASDWVAILPFVMMVADLDDGRFEIRPLDDPPFYSEFVLIEPSRKVMSPAAALFAKILKEQTERARSAFACMGKPLRRDRPSR